MATAPGAASRAATSTSPATATGADRTEGGSAEPVPAQAATGAAEPAPADGTSPPGRPDGSAEPVPAQAATGAAEPAPADGTSPPGPPDGAAEPATAEGVATGRAAAPIAVTGPVQLSFDDVGDDDDADDDTGDHDSGRTPAALRPLAGMGGKASSAGAGVMGALRVVRDAGTSRLLPSDPEARDALNARLRRAGSYLGAVAVACVLIYAVFPVRTYLDQRAATRRAQEQIEVISEQNDKLEDRVTALGTDEEVERIAREDYGMVRPGEESYGILPPPDPAQSTTTTAPGTAPASTPVTPAPGG